MNLRVQRLTSFLSLSFLLITAACLGLAQTPVFTHATSANSWMTALISPWKRSQAVSSDLREARDTYFDGLIGKDRPLTPATAQATYLAEGAFIGTPIEIPIVENRQMLIGTFASYEPVLSQSKKSIYTQVQFHVEDMLEQSQSANLSNNFITVIVPGGTVVNPDGSVLSFMTNPRHEFIVPTKRYLLVLSYHSTGDFNMLVRAWDISDGTARPGFNTLQSRFLGLPLRDLVSLARSRIGVR